MKKYILLFVFVTASLLQAQLKQELRAVWITNVASFVLSTDKAITDAVNLLASRGFTTIYPVVWNKGYTLYPSTVMDTAFGKPIDPAFATRDPLKKLVIEAHRAGLEVIPWFEFGFSCSYSQNGGHIIAKYPDWAAKNNAGALVVEGGFDWMSATNPKVQNFIISLVTEVLDKYDVDGIQGDDRLPGMPIVGSYDDTTKAIYRAENGGQNPPADYANINWKRWRANKLNDFFRRLRDSVKVRGTNLIVSAAPNPYPYGYDMYLQDSKTWVDSGIVDNFIPQLYRRDFGSYTGVVSSALAYIPTSKMGIVFSGMLAKVDTFIISPSYLLDGIAYNRSKGMKGESFFFYEAFPANNNKLADTLRATVYKDNAVPPYRNGNIWRPKAYIINETDPVLVTKSGAWEQESIFAYDSLIYWTNSQTPSQIEYKASFAFGAAFDVYVYTVPYFGFTQKARYTLYSGTDSSVVIVNQQDTKNTGWVYLGTVNAAAGTRKFLKLDNSLLEAGKYIVADAAMVMINRKKSPDVVITGTAGDNGRLNQPSEITLGQNYPNPFNPSTQINFSLPEPALVSLAVYDVTGRKVADVISPRHYAAGTHTVTFANTSVSSGVYFYRMQTGTNSITKKMVVIR